MLEAGDGGMMPGMFSLTLCAYYTAWREQGANGDTCYFLLRPKRLDILLRSGVNGRNEVVFSLVSSAGAVMIGRG